MNEYVEDYVAPPPLSDGEEAELWRRCKEDEDEEARARRIENYLPLGFDMAERMSNKFPTYLDVQDPIRYGHLGPPYALR